MNDLHPCGTVSANVRHRKNGEKVCRACLDAVNAYYAYWITDEFRDNLNMTPMIITDYVETFRPVTLVELVTLIQSKHGRAEGTIRRAVARMLNDGRLTRGVDIVTDDGRAAALPHCATDESVGYPVTGRGGLGRLETI